MVKGLWSAGLIVALCASLQGQSAPATAAFEIASVQPSAPSAITAMRGGAPRDGRYELRGATIVDLIRTAYTVDADKVVGGPHWLELESLRCHRQGAGIGDARQREADVTGAPRGALRSGGSPGSRGRRRLCTRAWGGSEAAGIGGPRLHRLSAADADAAAITRYTVGPGHRDDLPRRHAERLRGDAAASDGLAAAGSDR